MSLTPYLSLTEAEAGKILAAVTIPTCWSPRLRDEAVAILVRAKERQLSLLAESEAPS